MRKAVVNFLATGTYTGLSPVMPGTFGTLWGVAIAWLISGLGLAFQGAVIVAVCALSVWIASEWVRLNGGQDPPSVVCDEVSGYLVGFFLLPATAFNLILVFILFRFFDILKPCPVGLLDRKVKGGPGIVLDDLAAGVYANISAHIIIWLLW